MKQKEKKQSSGGVSLANLISIVGLVALGVFLYLGKAYSDGNKGMSLLFAIGLSALFACLLWLMIHAKGVDNDFKKWRFVEYTSLGMYVIVAIFSCSIISHFFSVNSQADALKIAANTDIEEIYTIVKDFHEREKEALNITVVGMRNAVNMRDFSANDRNLKDFFSENSITPDIESIKTFRELWESRIEKITREGKNYREVWLKRLDIIKNQVNGWSVMEIPDAIRDIEELGEIPTTLNLISSSLPFPAIERMGNGYQIAYQYTGNTYTVTLSFPEKVKNINDFSLIGIILALIIHVLTLFNYVVAYRSSRVPVIIRKKGYDAGRLLLLE